MQLTFVLQILRLLILYIAQYEFECLLTKQYIEEGGNDLHFT